MFKVDNKNTRTTLLFLCITRIFYWLWSIQHIFQCLPSAGVYLLKVNNGNCRAMSEFCHWSCYTHCSGLSIVNFEQVNFRRVWSRKIPVQNSNLCRPGTLFLMYLLLTCSRCLPSDLVNGLSLKNYWFYVGLITLNSLWNSQNNFRCWWVISCNVFKLYRFCKIYIP